MLNFLKIVFPPAAGEFPVRIKPTGGVQVSNQGKLFIEKIPSINIKQPSGNMQVFYRKRLQLLNRLIPDYADRIF